jgi:hypothetical protein
VLYKKKSNGCYWEPPKPKDSNEDCVVVVGKALYERAAIDLDYYMKNDYQRKDDQIIHNLMAHQI